MLHVGAYVVYILYVNFVVCTADVSHMRTCCSTSYVHTLPSPHPEPWIRFTLLRAPNIKMKHNAPSVRRKHDAHLQQAHGQVRMMQATADNPGQMILQRRPRASNKSIVFSKFGVPPQCIDGADILKPCTSSKHKDGAPTL